MTTKAKYHCNWCDSPTDKGESRTIPLYSKQPLFLCSECIALYDKQEKRSNLAELLFRDHQDEQKFITSEKNVEQHLDWLSSVFSEELSHVRRAKNA